MASLFTAYHLKVKAIASLTQIGLDGAVDVAAQRRLPDLRADAGARAQRKMSLYRNVRPLFLEQSGDRDAVLQSAEDLLVARGVVQPGDLIVLTIGEPMGKSGGTNTMKIVKVGEHRS